MKYKLLIAAGIASLLFGCNTAEKYPLMAGSTENVDWRQIEPINTTPQNKEAVRFKISGQFLQTPNIVRRDPSDVIKVDDTYYVWYTKITSDTKGYPEGWGGSVWYATSKDGHKWTEKGEAVPRGPKGSWDGYGTYTPNVVEFNGKYYLGYTAMPDPFIRKISQAQIGIAVADSPNGPWQKVSDKPSITVSESTQQIDSFLVDDTVFVVNNDQVYLYYKGFPKWKDEAGKNIRNKVHSTFMTFAVADTPAGPYKKHNKPLLRAHEIIAWKAAKDKINSMSIGWGKFLLYESKNGIDFFAKHPLKLDDGNFGLRAAGFYRKDLTGNHKPARPNWGICMANGGLARFEIIWPKK